MSYKIYYKFQVLKDKNLVIMYLTTYLGLKIVPAIFQP